MSSLFLCLPPELRDQIYHHALLSTRLTFREHSLLISLLYGPAASSPQKLPQWLLTSKQFLYEGLQQFYRRAECTRWEVCSPPDTLASGCESRAAYGLLTLYRVRTISSAIKISFLRVDMGSGSSVAGRGIATVALDPWLKRDETVEKFASPLVSHLSLLSHSLRNITFRIRIPIGFPKIGDAVADYKRLRVDLPFLESLGTGLNKVEFVIDDAYVRKIDTHAVMACEIIFERIRNELLKIGKTLVGASNDEAVRPRYTVKEWIEEQWYDYLNECNHDWHLEVRRGQSKPEQEQSLREGLTFWTDKLARCTFGVKEERGGARDYFGQGFESRIHKLC